MAILNFPNDPQTDDQYTGDNGTTYIFDGVKWVGRAAGGAAGTNSLQNGSFTVQVDVEGDLVLPVGSIIKDADGNSVGSGGTSDRLVNGDYEVILGDSGAITFPNVISITNLAPTEQNRYGGDINITGQRGYGNWQTDGSAGWGASVYLTAGDGGETEVSNAGGEGGEVRIRAGNGQAGENGGKVSLIAGDALWNNSGSAVHGGEARIKAGNATENADGFGVGGNVNISAGEGDQSNGSVYINTTGGDNTWTFDAAGVLTLPSGNTRIGNVFGSDSIVGNTGTTVGILSQGTGGSTALQWVDDIENIETSTPVAAVVVNSPLAATSGTVQVLTGVSGNGISSNVWEFDAAGVLHLPETGDIVDSNGDSVLGGGSTSYTPDEVRNWNDPTVNTIAAALDELAARVTALQNYEIDGGNANTPELGELLIDGNGA